MPLELQIIRASEFVRVNASEQLDFEASVKALQMLALACRMRGLNSAIVDLRGMPVPSKPQFTTKQLAGLVSAFRQAGFSRHERLAILYSVDVYGGTRTFAFLSRLSGLQVQAFAEFERAFEWISEDRESNLESRPGEIAIPVGQFKEKRRKIAASSRAAKRRFRG